MVKFSIILMELRLTCTFVFIPVRASGGRCDVLLSWACFCLCAFRVWRWGWRDRGEGPLSWHGSGGVCSLLRPGSLVCITDLCSQSFNCLIGLHVIFTLSNLQKIHALMYVNHLNLFKFFLFIVFISPLTSQNRHLMRLQHVKSATS